MAGGVPASTTCTEAFRRRHGEEWGRLRERLHAELQQDISRIFAGSLYCDLELVFDSSSIQAHCCILRTRAAKFFSKLCSVAELRPLPNGSHCVRLVRVPEAHIKNFLRNLYTKCSVAEEELEVIKHLEQLGWTPDSDPSPESDAYLTPYSSPSEAWPDLSLDLRSYYSIVPIDEDAALGSGSTSPVLERELAEQDVLLRSFQTIRSRNVRRKAKKPTSLPLLTGHCAWKQRQAYSLRESNRRSYLTIPDKDRVKNDFLSSEKSCLVNSEDCECGPDIAQNDDVSEVSVTGFVECCSKGTEDPLTFPLSPEMDGSAGGPDSGLDTCSTGFVPGGDFSSPRDYTISETSGVDLTEAAAAGEDMPLDEGEQPKSSSSSVSSEPITWDIYVSSMCNETTAFLEAERKHSQMCAVGAPPGPDNEWCELEDGLLSLSVPTDQVEHYCCREHVGPECELLSAPLVDPSPSDSTTSSNTQSSSAKEESQPRKTITSITVSLSYPEARTDWRITNGHNFFINAADLIDDSDTSLPYVNVTQPAEAKELTPVLDDSPLERSQCDIVDKGLSGYRTVRSNFTEDDALPVGTSAEEFSEDFIPFLTSRPALDNMKDLMSLSGRESLAITGSEVAIPFIKQTSQQASISRQSSIQDHTAEFQKEITVVEHLEPYVETRKIVLCKRRQGSVSTEDVSCSSPEFANLGKSDDKISDPVPTCTGFSESAFPNVRTEVLHTTENEVILSSKHSVGDPSFQMKARVSEPRSGEEEEAYKSSINKHEISCSTSSKDEVASSGSIEHKSPTSMRESDVGKDVQSVEGKGPRRASLIRRNTFELDPDDDRLALLRQEYERRQGNLLFQSCSPQFSGSDGIVEDSPTQLHSLPCLPPEGKNSHSSPTPVKSPHVLPHVVGHELNTPDSLNNDGPIDSLFVTQTKTSGISEKTCSVKDSAVHLSSDKLENNGDNFPARPGDYNRSCKPVVSGALTCSDVVLDQNQSCESPKKQKRTESTPIVSGGVAASDFVSPPQPKIDSPIFSRRKNELAPILSGGAVCVPKPDVKEKKENMSASIGSAWVVDMSDCSPNTARQSFDFKRRRRSEASHELLANPPIQDSENNSLGFFVNLEEPIPKESSPTNSISFLQKDQPKKSKEFFVEVGESVRSPVSRKKDITAERSVQKSKSHTDVPARTAAAPDISEKSNGTGSVKNTMFSMFIDIGSPIKSKEKALILKEKTHSVQKKVIESGMDSENSSDGICKSSKINRVNNTTFDVGGEPVETQKSTYMFIDAGPTATSVQMTTPAKSTGEDSIKTAVEEKKQSFFMFIETESPVPRRKTLPSGLRPTFNRHSWNSDAPIEKRDDESSGTQVKVHKRAHSLSVDRSAIFEEGKPPLARSKMRRSSHSLHEDDSTPSSSQGKLPNRIQGRLPKQTRSLEVDDSVKAGSDKCLRSKQLSGSSTEVEDSTHSPGISQSTGPDEDCSASCTDPSNTKGNASSSATITESEDRGKPSPASKVTTVMNCEEEKHEPVSFVKLSDLDKEPKKVDADKPSPIATTTRMSRSIPETSWIESKLMMTRSIGGGGSVAPSSRSLNRLFPHLHTAGISAPVHGKSPEPEEGDTQVSETSDLSSMQSSMGPSGLEGSTEETDASSSCAGRGTGPASRLGEDLLRMFLEEISPDVTVEVGGRRLRAHKCILSSRCQYFAAMLSGGWVESAGNVISLQGFSYNAVHFALCHIYSGTSNIPDTISIVELATLADMLGLEGLKEVIMYTLKVKYCHFFHKPCTMCAVGVVECLPLAAAYGLDDIYRKSLRWITRHFVRIWPTKGFASLPRELLDKCYQQHVVHMTADNVLETIMNCDKLLATLPSVRWAEPVFTITSQLLEAAVKFLANNFCPVLNSDSFLALGKELSWNISRLEDSLMAAADRLPPDQACQSHAHLHRTLAAEQHHSSQSFSELLRRLQKRVEASLVRQAARAARCPSWSLMDLELRHKVQEAAFLVLVPGEEAGRCGKQSTPVKRAATQQRGGGAQRTSRSLDIRQVKLAMTQQARRVASGGRVSVLQADARTRAQSAAPGHRKQKSEPPPAPKKAEDKPAPEPLVRPKTWPLRVMESKARPSRQGAGQPSASTPDKQGSTVRRQGKTLISSSDSSRTSSPAMRRAASSGGRRKQGEVSAISVDSLTDEGSGRRTVSDGAMSKSLISTRPDTPSVVRKKRDETTMSADSLSEKPMPSASVSAPSRSSAHTRPDTPPTKGKARQSLGRFASDGTISSDSLANTDSSPRDGVGDPSSSGKAARPTVKSTVDHQQRSPSMRRVALRQSASSPRESPAFRRNLVTSGKLPADCTTSKPATAKSNKAAATLSPGAKRPVGKVGSRGNTKAAPVSSPKLPASRPISKVAPNRSTTKGPAPAAPREGKKGCAVVNGDVKEEPQPVVPTVGSRSGTFLKDEPTVIKLPAVKDVDE